MERYNDLPIGIDLGTTFCCMGVYRNGGIEIIPNERGERTTPSIISFIDDKVYTGEQAEYKTSNQKNRIYAVKRIIGRNFDDKEVQEDIGKFAFKVNNNNNRPQIEVNSNGVQKFFPEEISAKLLYKLKQSAESFLNQKIKKVVITVPAYFTERQKKATKNAGEIAGLEVIKIINEPTAASLAYGFGKCPNKGVNIIGKNVNSEFQDVNNENNPKKEIQNIMVFDLGGGTLDVTLLELENDNITIKAHSGKMHLGGEDFDNILVQYCIEQFRKKTSIDLNKEQFIEQKMRLKEHCIRAKKKLSFNNKVEIEIESLVNGKDLNLTIQRTKFEELCENIFNSCLEPVQDVLDKSGDEKKDIDEIILVGGSTKIPRIQEILSDFFGGKELNNSLNPDEAIAYGATIEAAMQMGEYAEDITLLDVCPFSLGVSIFNQDNNSGNYMDIIIKKGTALPCIKKKIYKPAKDYQKSVLIEVFEGENKYTNNNYPLGNFSLENLPQRQSKDVHIEVTFELDEDSILTVRAEDLDNRENSNSIIIKNDKGGLSKNEIEKAKKNRKNMKNNEDINLKQEMQEERNYKSEINKLIGKINSLNESQEQYNSLKQLEMVLENFMDTFKKDIKDNFTYLEKMHYYLNYLFITYSSLLNYKSIITEEEKELIILKVKNYLQIFAKNGLSFAASLVKAFKYDDRKIFGEFCEEVLQLYNQKGMDLYFKKENEVYFHHYTYMPKSNKNFDERLKKSKHYFEEGLSFINKYSINNIINSNLYTCALGFIESIKSLLAIDQRIEKDILIKDYDNINEEEKIAILDRFKEALDYVSDTKNKEEYYLKSMYLANIAKIEYKMFKSNNYDALLKMIEDCIGLKMKYPLGWGGENEWFKEICRLKLEIEQKKKSEKRNPKEAEKKIKQNLKDIFDTIEGKYNQGIIPFFFYILSEHKPHGLKDDYIFENPRNLETKYQLNRNKFLRELKKLYNPQRYKGDKEEERKVYFIMQRISAKLNDI